MLSMQEKTFLGLMVAVLSAQFVIPVRTYEVQLVTSPAGSIYVPAGEPFDITCRGSSGDEEPKFSSMKWIDAKGNAITERVPGVQQREENNSLKLSFLNPKVEESGVYKCVAVYEGHALQSDVKVTFHNSKPSFLFNFENVTATEGSRLEIDCTALGDRSITYEWYNQYEDRITGDTNASIFVSNSENGSTLVIPKVSRSDEGTYTCTASNQLGLSSKLYMLTVGNDTTNGTLVIRSVKAVNITSNSVNFEFDIIPGTLRPYDAIAAKCRESRNATEYTAAIWSYGDNRYEVTGLIPGGLYDFRFITTGNDTFTRPYQVTLLPDKPEVIFHNMERESVEISWYQDFDDRMRGTTDMFELRYFLVSRKSGDKGWEPSKCVITVQVPSCIGSYTIAGLFPKVYYEIQLRAHTASGYGEPYTQKVYFS